MGTVTEFRIPDSTCTVKFIDVKALDMKYVEVEIPLKIMDPSVKLVPWMNRLEQSLLSFFPKRIATTSFWDSSPWGISSSVVHHPELDLVRICLILEGDLTREIIDEVKHGLRVLLIQDYHIPTVTE